MAVGVLVATIAMAAAGCDIATEVVIDCNTGQGLEVPIRTAVTPDSVAYGASVEVRITPDLFARYAGVDITSGRWVFPLPDGVAPLGAPTLVGGDVPGVAFVEGRDVILQLGSFNVTRAVLPTVTFRAQVNVFGPATVAWKVFRSFELRLFNGQTVQAVTCVPHDPGFVLNNTDVARPTPPSTGPLATTTTTTTRPRA